MARHIFFIDPLDKLVIKKDSTLLMAHTFKEAGHEVFMLFEKDFYITNKNIPAFEAYSFESSLKNGSFYLDRFEMSGAVKLEITQGDTIHMRIDPPFDTRYLRYLWMLRYLKGLGATITNDPEGILLHNEKMTAYHDQSALESYIGKSSDSSESFLSSLKEKGVTEVILKPLDLYQGIGVIKTKLENVREVNDLFLKQTEEWEGPGIIQPFNSAVEKGEVRAIFFKNKEIGSIIKVPIRGDFLANIARGASFEKVELNQTQMNSCLKVSRELEKYGVDLIAFDILGDALNEVNVTCPGLLVEVSEAHGKNLALDLL